MGVASQRIRRNSPFSEGQTRGKQDQILRTPYGFTQKRKKDFQAFHGQTNKKNPTFPKLLTPHLLPTHPASLRVEQKPGDKDHHLSTTAPPTPPHASAPQPRSNGQELQEAHSNERIGEQVFLLFQAAEQGCGRWLPQWPFCGALRDFFVKATTNGEEWGKNLVEKKKKKNTMLLLISPCFQPIPSPPTASAEAGCAAAPKRAFMEGLRAMPTTKAAKSWPMPCMARTSRRNAKPKRAEATKVPLVSDVFLFLVRKGPSLGWEEKGQNRSKAPGCWIETMYVWLVTILIYNWFDSEIEVFNQPPV